MAKHHSKHHSHSEGKKHGAQHMHIHHHKKKGGRVGMEVSGNPAVMAEAHDDKDGAETGYERKHGGRAKKHKHHRKTGGKVLGLMTGGGVRPRLDRPGRKRGGAVGANTSPLSTAHGGGHGATGSSNPSDTYGGTPD
jgi:hypothetical protein